jgi:hypothetical protein
VLPLKFVSFREPLKKVKMAEVINILIIKFSTKQLSQDQPSELVDTITGRINVYSKYFFWINRKYKIFFSLGNYQESGF